MRPTEEQQSAVDLFTAGGNVVVEALAGTGKTAALRFMADTAPNRRGLYAAFNRSIAQEAQRRFQGTGVNARTMHSLAYAEYGVPMRHRLGKQPPLKPTEKAQILGITDKYVLTSVEGDGLPGALSRQQLVTCAQHTVNAFLRTLDPDVTADAVYLPPTLEPKLKPAAAAKLRDTIAGFAQTYWRDLQDPNGRLRYIPDAYLKAWALSKPELPFDYILFDECQDADPIITAVLQGQPSQVVAVGDRHQAIYCQPAGTMVEVPVPDVPADEQCRVATCRRRRNHKTSKMCHLHELDRRAGLPIRAIPNGRGRRTQQVPIESLVPGQDVVTYSNGHIFKTGRPISSVSAFDFDGDLVVVEIGGGTRSKYAPKHHCVVRVGDELRDKHVVYMMRRGSQFRVGRVPFTYVSQNGTSGLAARVIQEKADAAWILSIHDDARSAAQREVLVQARYGLPGLRFNPHKLDRIDLNQFWSQLGPNSDRAQVALEAHGRLIDFPLFTRGRYAFTYRRPFVTAAANLIDGMAVLPSDQVHVRRQGTDVGTGEHRANAEAWHTVKVSREAYKGKIYSLEVADHHTYFADGILTHNSWRGAVNAMDAFGGERTMLRRSFRFGPAIAEYANMWLEALGAPDDMRLIGSDKLATVRRRTPGSGRQPDAVLTRTNAAAIEEIVTAQEHGVDTGIAGEKKSQELRSLAQAALDLKQRGWTSHPELSVFNTWADVRVHADSDDGADMKPLVDLVDRVGADQVVAAIDACVPVDQARTTVSTAHVAKGLEWAQVHIAEDFREPPRKKGIQQPMRAEEARLAYVAATRAKRFLDPRGLEWFPRFLEAGGTVAEPSAGYAEMKEAS